MFRNLVNSGKEITVPEKNVTIGDWTGTGYIALNPENGTGTYMIDGGLSGGRVSLLDRALIAIFFMCFYYFMFNVLLAMGSIIIDVVLFLISAVQSLIMGATNLIYDYGPTILIVHEGVPCGFSFAVGEIVSNLMEKIYKPETEKGYFVQSVIGVAITDFIWGFVNGLF